MPISDKKIRLKRLFDLLSNRRFLWVIILVAIAVRLLYALVFLGIDFPYIDNISTDSYYFHKMGIIIAHTPEKYLSAFHPPLYPIFLALLFRIAGDGYIPMVIAHTLLDIAALLLLWSIVRRLLSPVAAGLAALIYALYPEFIFLSGHMISEALYIPLLMLSLYLLIVMQEDNRKRTAVFAGFALALAALTRANIAIFPFLLIPWAVVILSGKIKARILKWLLMCGCFVALLIPWTIRNYLVFDTFVPITTGAGESLNHGANPQADGGASLPRDDVPLLMENPIEEINNQKEHFNSAYQWIIQNPGAYLSLAPKKLFRFFTFYSPISQPENFNLYFWGGAFTYLPLAGLALLGFFISIKRWRKYLILYLLVFSYLLTVIIFYGEIKLRIPLIPVYIIFGCLTVSKLLHWKTDDKKIEERQREVIQARTNH